ncbi:MAG: hypothetical protein KF779_14050 [Hyphomonadaceae bacterium]|nr:hypothetical protein [Hyphomonadaceae bacterium]
MMLRRVMEHLRKQEWTAIAIDFVIVVLGVFVATQVSNWNEEREAAIRRDQIVATLVADLRDAQGAQLDMEQDITAGVAGWQEAFAAGERPPPYFLRIPGSDTAPRTWDTLRQMQLADMFDPVTLFDLGFYYSELEGVGVKYVRYVTFVENEILPYIDRDPSIFYLPDGSGLRPEYAASMDRALEYAHETHQFRQWANCLVYRLESHRHFAQSCRRANYVLEGMTPVAETGL